MKKFFVISFIFVASITFVEAQPGTHSFQGSIESYAKTQKQAPKTFEEQLEFYVNELTDSLSLTIDQGEKIKVIETDLKEQKWERIKKVMGDPLAQFAINDDITNLREEKVKLVLTSEQFKKYQKLYPKVLLMDMPEQVKKQLEKIKPTKKEQKRQQRGQTK